MAKTKLDNAIIQILSSQHSELQQKALSKPDPSVFEKLSKQRHRQRGWLFFLAMFWLSISIIGLFSLIGINSYLRVMKGNNFSLFNQFELEVLSVSVFGQLVGIVAIIAKSLWDESPFAKMLEKDYDETHKIQ